MSGARNDGPVETAEAGAGAQVGIGAGASTEAGALLTRVAEARVKLAEAAATADLSGVAQALDELEDAHRLARANGITVPAAHSELGSTAQGNTALGDAEQGDAEQRNAKPHEQTQSEPQTQSPQGEAW